MPKKVRVIVVHGIGSQKVGSTAARWADSLVRFGRAAGYRPDVSTAKLTSDPAEVTVQLTFPADAPETATPTVVFAIEEAHWAESFPEPSVGRVLRFLATVAPVLAITQSILIWRERKTLWQGGRPALQAAGHVTAQVAPLALGILALGLAAPLIAVLLLVLLLGASLPIPAVRTAVGKTLGWLSTSIGDAYLFVADPVNRAAMQARLAARLATQTSDSPPTVVLAHSQGAALAYRALSAMTGSKPVSLITVGSGVGRLHQVGLLQTLPWYLTPLFVLVVSAAAAGIAWGSLPHAALLLFSSAVLGVIAWDICARWLDRTVEREQDLLPKITGTAWLDIWASFDPVPNGRTAKDTGDTSYQLARVAGEQSLVRDHVRYDRDWDQTMPLIFRRLLEPAGPDRIPYVGVRPDNKDRRKRTRERRIPLAARDWCGLLLRALPLGAVAIPLYAVDLFSLGQWLRTAPPGFLDSTIDTVFVPLRTVSGFLEATWVRAPRPQELLAALVLLGLGLAGSVLTRRVLTFFQRRETTLWLREGGLRPGRIATRWGNKKWGKTQLGKARWPLALLVVAAAAAVIPVFLLWADERIGGAEGKRLDWTRAQTVEAYLTAVAEDDTHALCDVTRSDITERVIDGKTVDVCGTDDQDKLRTCEAGRTAVAALDEDAFTFRPGGVVEVTWAPEVAGTCEERSHWLALPTRVELDEEGWQITDVTDPKEEEEEE